MILTTRTVAAVVAAVGLMAIVAPGGRAQVALSSFANFENAPIHPLDMTPDGTRLLAANITDGRLEVFSLGGTLPVWTTSIPVGIDPVSVRARTNTEVWVVNQVSDTVSVVDLATGNVIATLKPGNEPCDVVFVGSGAAQRAYVSISRENALAVFDPNNRAAAPMKIALQGSCPKSMATDGTRVFAAFFEAGNRTSIANRATVDNPAGPWAGVNPPPNVVGGTFSPALNPLLPPGPPASRIWNREGTNPGNWKDAANVVWNALIPWTLHEHGVAIYTPSTATTTYALNIANINMALSVQPTTGKVTITGHHLTNYIRFEPNHRSSFGRPLLFTFDPLNPPGSNGNAGSIFRDLNSHLFANGVSVPYITNPTPAQTALSVCDPRAVVWRDANNAYVAGMGSNNVVRVNPALTPRQATVNVGKGPCGLAYDSFRSRLYVFNRFDGTLSSINTATDVEVGRVAFFDPTPTAIKTGRDLHYDAHATSKLGMVSCNSCHVDTRSDMQPWDAGNPAGSMVMFGATCDAGKPFSGTCNDWHPIKGPLMTQNLADTVSAGGAGPLHWRGDRSDILAFDSGFVGFLGLAAGPSPAQMQTLGDFYATLRREPNPYRTAIDDLPASVSGFIGNPINGAALFSGPAIGGAVASCTTCHTQPSGGGLTVISPNIIGQSQGLKAPPLRDLYVKTGFDRSSSSGRRGFGFAHDGATETLQQLLLNHFAPGATAQQRADLEAFLMCFPSGTHPAVGTQVTLDATNSGDAVVTATIATLSALADSGAIGLVAHGRVGGLPRGYIYLPGGTVQSDRLAETTTLAALRTAANGGVGNEVTLTAVVIGTHTRLGVDRDGDGAYDRDELDHGTDPNNAGSFPAPCIPDFNHSGTVTVQDIFDFLAAYFAGDPAADINHAAGITVQDIFDFLAAYFAGCP